MDSLELRRLKEEFVSNLEGTSKLEIWLAISCVPLCLLLGALLQAQLQESLRNKTPTGNAAKLAAAFSIQAAAALLPQLAVTMGGVPAGRCFPALLALACLGCWWQLRSQSSKPGTLHLEAAVRGLTQRRLLFISLFRGGIMLYTCLCILAVDFQAFPRRFAKAETYGTGLMDLGVGATIFAGGLVSKAIDEDAWRSTSLKQRLVAAGRASLPVVLLGLGRLAATGAVDYQHHVGEYGVHWNFFLTIAAVGLLTTLTQVPASCLLPMCLATITTYQALLSLGFSDWVHSPEREAGLISMNKEGLCSLWGFWALYLLGAATGHQLQQKCRAAAAQALGTPAVAAAGGGGGGGGGGVPAGAPAAAAAGATPQKQQQQRQQQQQGGVSPPATPYNLRPRRQLQATGAAPAATPATPRSPGSKGIKKAPAAAAATAGAGGSGSTEPGLLAASRQQQQQGTGGAPGLSQLPAEQVLRTWLVSWLLLDLGAWGLLHLVEELVEPVSRRSCNLPYVLWVCVQCWDLLLLCLLVQLASSATCLQASQQQPPAAAAKPPHTPAAGGRQRRVHKEDPVALQQQQQRLLLLPQAFNRNLLAVFLLANLLTGLVNLSTNTLAVGAWQARAIVGLYMVAVCAVAVALDQRGISIKL